jgi:tRNA(adenine34) deaminase
MKIHEAYMTKALKQAERAYALGEVPTGCIVVAWDGEPFVSSGRTIGQAHNQVEQLNDPTAHAEMIAITQAAATLGDWRLVNTTLYVTKEPCAMCAGAIVLARIPTLVFGTADPRRGGAVSRFNIVTSPELIHRCTVIQGILEAECRNLLQTFFLARRQAAKTRNVTTQVDSRCTLNSQRKVGRAFLPDPEALESQPGMADLPRLPEQLPRNQDEP